MSAEVSTIIPAFNAERTIVQAIDSALAQDCEDHEVVVVNDGSTDATSAVLQKYSNRIQIITLPNRGASVARNAGVAGSTGRYLAFLDADDIWLPGKLEIMTSALKRNPLASLAFSDYSFIDDNGAACGELAFGHAFAIEELASERFLPVFSFGTGILPSTWVIPRQVFERTGGFCEEFKRVDGFEDQWMLLLLRELGEFVYVPGKLTLYRVGESGKKADRYARGLPTFVAQVKRRYGKSGKGLIRDAKNVQCRRLLSKVAHQMNNKDRLGSIRTLARIARHRPAYFFGPEFTQRLLLRHNMKRLWDLVAAPLTK
ncbi:MAG: glycosyltransferase family A protein [Candidatus Sulfotelmatobacter sp.]